MTTRQNEKTQWDTKKAGEHEPACASQMDVFPVLHYDYDRDGNRHQYCERGGDAQRNAEGQQRNRD